MSDGPYRKNQAIHTYLTCDHVIVFVPTPIKNDVIWCLKCDAPSVVSKVEGYTEWVVTCFECEYMYEFGNEPRTASVRSRIAAINHSKKGHVSLRRGIDSESEERFFVYSEAVEVTGSLRDDMVELYRSLKESQCSASESTLG